MAQQLSGAPKVVVDVADKSLLFNNDSTSIYCVQGKTARGKVHKPFFVRNRTEFIRQAGDRIEESDFPFYCMRMLDAGAQLWISRVAHYTDPTDNTTIEGTKATGKVSDGGAVEVLGTANAEITAAGADGDIWTLTVNNGTANLTVSTYTEQAGDGVAEIMAGLVAAITEGYTATPGAAGAFVITAPIGSGAASSTYVNALSSNGAGTATIDPNFAGGTNAVENAVYFEAEAIGDGYNGTQIEIAASASLDPNTVDILVTLTDSDETTVVADFPNNPTQSQIDEFNQKLEGVQITYVFNNTISAIGTGVLAGGVQDYSAIDDDDYIGDSIAKNGWYSFGTVSNAFRIANIERPSPNVDIGLVTYVKTRKGGDMRVHTATPIGVDPDGAKDYRKGEGIYSHTPINDWIASLWAGQVNVNDPSDSTRRFDIPGIVDFLGQRAKTDTRFGQFWTAAGPKRGVIQSPNNGVGTPNFIAPEYLDAFNDAYENGVNAIVDDEAYGTTVWGNRSLLNNNRSLLSKENVADLAMYIKRSLEPLVRTELFDPNDPTMWKQVYRNVVPFINDLEARRGIVPGENTNWFWIGDQEANTIDEAVFNSQNDLANGRYKARFVFVPITATEYIGIDVVVTDANSVAAVVANPNF